MGDRLGPNSANDVGGGRSLELVGWRIVTVYIYICECVGIYINIHTYICVYAYMMYKELREHKE